MTSHHHTKAPGRQCSDPGPGKESHGRQVPTTRHHQETEQDHQTKRAAKKLKLEQATKRDVMAAVHRPAS